MRLPILYRYLIKNNLKYLIICSLSCISIYLLVDLFDRLDNFLSKLAPFKWIINYFLWKIPIIISQIFPMVFFLTLIIQFSLMKKNREWEALEGGGIFIGNVVAFILIYSFLFSIFQIIFSQYIGVMAIQKTNAIWDNLGKKKIIKHKFITNFWFRKGKYIGYIGRLNEEKREGDNFQIYEVTDNFSRINLALLAKKGRILKNKLILSDVLLSYPDEFGIKKVVSYEIKEKDMDVILDITGSKNIESIPVWKLRGLIRELKETGTNVGSIMTVWYSKLSYGLSLIFLGLLSLFIGKRSDNLPLNLAIGLITIFLFYGLYVTGTILGKHSVVPPFIGAFGVHIVFAFSLIYAYMKNSDFSF
ncbi:LptF/LptG family permease [Desulfothermus okinawensis JCM 13304]